MKILRAWRSLRRHMGLRGDVLLSLGIIDIAQAASLVSNTPLSASYAWFGSVAPLYAWAVLWAGTGGICIYHAFRRDDHFGYVAAIGIKVLWGVGCFFSWLLTDATVLTAVIWFVFAFLTWRIGASVVPLPMDEDDAS